MKKLSDKQRRFCEEYMIDLNATRAAREAGYSEKTACKIGSENLSKPDIQAYIQQLRAEQKKRTEISADRVLQEFAAIAFTDVEDVLKVSNSECSILPKEKRTAHSRKALKKVKFSRRLVGKGEDAYELETVEVELNDKQKALENLGRHLGIYEKDNEQGAASGVMLVPMCQNNDDWEKAAEEAQQKLLDERED